jgi:SsrA-binding protein
MPRKKPEEYRSVARNKKARHAFEVLEELECGVSLVGTEVKSLRAGECSIQEAYARIQGGELWLVGATIPEYRHGNSMNHEPGRSRKLLAHRREIEKWSKRVRERGMTIVPLEVYFQGSRVKVKVGLCRGKKLHDKRDTQRERDDRRQMERALRRRR